MAGDSEPINVAVTFTLDPAAIARIEAVSPRVRVLDFPPLPLAPGVRLSGEERERALELLPQVEVLFGSGQDPYEFFEAAANLRWFQSIMAGLDALIGEGLLRLGFTVTNVSGVAAVSIAEYCIGTMVMLEKGLHTAVRDQVKHQWNFHFAGELRGQTCGIVGMGAIGRELARRARAFGMRVIATRRTVAAGDKDPDADELYPYTELPRLLAASDYVVLCVPLTKETERLIGGAELAAMKPGAKLVNIARGALVDQAELTGALREDASAVRRSMCRIRSRFRRRTRSGTCRNVIITPHMSGAVSGYPDRVTSLFVANLERYIRGEPLMNVVDPVLAY